MIFVVGVGMSWMLEAEGLIHSPRPADALQFYLWVIGDLFFCANGVWACYWPLSFQRRYIPQLRSMQEDALSKGAKKRLVISGKCWGAALILVSSYLTHLIGVAAL